MENDTVRPYMNRLQALRAKTWPIFCAILMTFFAATRLYNLGARPLHHDEGVNGNFLKNLISQGNWHYDPENYHGPTLFLFHVFPTWINSYINDGGGTFNKRSISGITPIGIRLPIAIIGILVLWMILESWPLMGKIGAGAACLFAGLSCDILFFSRYFIHETYMLLFMLGVVFSAQQFLRTRDVLFAYLTALSATLLLATKETGLFHIVVLVLAYVSTQITKWLSDGANTRLSWRLVADEPSAAFRQIRPHLWYIVALCAAVWIALFSSFFTNPRGPIDSLRAFMFWGSQGVKSGHVKPFFYYITSILIRYETVVLIFGVIGIGAAFVKNERKGLFYAYWTLGIIAFYSLVPYKTPWLVINMVLPLALVAGYGVQTVYDLVMAKLSPIHARLTLAALALVGVTLAIGEAHQTYRVNYVEYDSDKHPQIYAHTVRDIFNLVSKIDAVSTRAGGRDMVIKVFSDAYWPLPVYLNRYPSVRYWGDNVTDVEKPDAPVLIVSPRNQTTLDPRLKNSYSIQTYTLRPGVPLLLYVNTNFASNLNAVPGEIDLLKPQPVPNGLKPKLKFEAFKGSDFSGKPTYAVDGDTSFDFDWPTDPSKKYQSPFSLRWTGFIRVETAGVYRFALESDDGSWLKIDDVSVVDNGGDHAATKLSRTANMSVGYHKIEIKYDDVGGQAVLHFLWTPPKQPEEIVPDGVLFHQP